MIKKLNLHEWFLIYQLEYIEKNYAHLNMHLEVDISKICDHFTHSKIPMSTSLVKDSGLWLESTPLVRKQIFKTIFGKRLYINEHNSVTVPIVLNNDGEKYVSIMNIENVANKTLSDISSEFKQYSTTQPKTLPIGKNIIGKKNNFFNRTRLKLIHFTVNNFPSIQDKYKVGTVSVSSLLKFDEAMADVTPTAKGPGAMTICITTVELESKKMKLGVAWEHQTGDGYAGIQACQKLCHILQGNDEELFKRLLN